MASFSWATRNKCHSILFHDPPGNAQDISQGVISRGLIGLHTYHLGFVISPYTELCEDIRFFAGMGKLMAEHNLAKKHI